MATLNERIFRRVIILSIILPTFIVHEIKAQNTRTEILWDNYGVPHIYAKDTKQMFYAFGWAQMNNHANLLLRVYGQARGRSAEYWGTEYLASDKQILLYDLPGKGLKMYEQQTPEYKKYIDAFVKGINDYATSYPEAIGQEYKQILPITSRDVFAHVLRVLYRFLSNNERSAVGKLVRPGSNAYAIAPSRSTSKTAMLATLPHLPWKSDFTTMFEAHLNTSNFNAYGTTFVGFPMLFLAFNDNLGWTHTVNTLDASDRYELSLVNGGYLLDGQTIPFEKKTVMIKVRQNDGKFQEQKMEIKISKHGPVIGENGNKAYVVRIAGLDNFKIFEEYHKMTKAKNWKEFETALKMLQIPMFNVIYADKTGNIFYLFNGNVPKRPEGDFAFWRGTIDGTKSKLIWQQTLSYKDLPKLFNPKTGFIQNSNDPPWTCTYPVMLEPKNFLPYIAPLGMGGLRPQRAVNMIKNNASISFNELIGIKQNTGMEAADRFLDDLLIAVNKYPDTTALKAASVLKAWDKKTDSNSKGAILFANWFDRMDRSMYAIPWSLEKPVTTPDGLKDEKKAVELLIIAANEVEKKYRVMDIPWGNVYRFRWNGIDFPASGGPGEYGIFRSFDYVEEEDNKRYADIGETYVAITEFGKKVKAQVLLCYGNASQPGSKHIGDQIELLSQKKLRPALLSKKEVLNHLESKKVFNAIGQ